MTSFMSFQWLEKKTGMQAMQHRGTDILLLLHGGFNYQQSILQTLPAEIVTPLVFLLRKKVNSSVNTKSYLNCEKKVNDN